MKISIITTTYISSAIIENCIASINDQTCPNVEHIIVDGASKDNTIDIIKSTTNRVSKIISEPDYGIYDALNKGINLSSGSIIGFLHSDDLLASEDIISRIIKKFEETGADGVYGDLVYVDKKVASKIIRFWKSKPFKRKLLNRGWMPAHPTLFLKKEVYEKHGQFDLDFKIAADYDFMLRIMKDTELKFAYLPKVITKMRMGGTSNRNLKNIIQKSKEDYKALKKNNFSLPLWVLFLKNINKIPQFFKRQN